MIEILERMFSDRLWIYTAICGSLIGAAFLAYFRHTRTGIWAYGKFDQLLDFLVDRWGWTWFKQDDEAWRKKYPHVTKKIDELEDRIKVLEKRRSK